jgi:hypothetical protein
MERLTQEQATLAFELEDARLEIRRLTELVKYRRQQLAAALGDHPAAMSEDGRVIIRHILRDRAAYAVPARTLDYVEVRVEKLTAHDLRAVIATRRYASPKVRATAHEDR